MSQSKARNHPPRILFLCQYFYPEYVSSSTLPTQLAQDLAMKGFLVHALCGVPFEYYSGNPVPRSEEYSGIHIKRMWYLKANRKRDSGRFLNYISFMLSSFIHLGELAHYDCIIVYSNPPVLPCIASLANVLFGTKFIFVAYDIYPDLAIKLGKMKPKGISAFVMRSLNSIVFSKASRIVVLGGEMREYLLENKIVVDGSRIQTIPNWFQSIQNDDKELIERGPVGDIPKENFIVLYSGNMGICQDLETLKDAILLLKHRADITFLFTGHGSKLESLKAWEKAAKVHNIRIHGFVKSPEYERLLRQVHCCLVSLERGVEGLSVPSKAYGYLAAGKPVIAVISDSTDLAKALKSFGAGEPVRQGDSRRLADIILRLADNRPGTARMGDDAARLFASEYERSICTNQYSTLIASIVSEDAAWKK